MHINTNIKIVLSLLSLILLSSELCFASSKNIIKDTNNHEFDSLTSNGKINDLQDKEKLTGKNVKIAILDTGILINHKDFSNNIIKVKNFIPNEDKKNVMDKNIHGTKMASIIAAEKNGKNVKGIAPNSKLLIGKVANNEGYTMSDWLAKGIVWATDNKADIINISLQLHTDNKNLKDAVDYATSKNIIIIASVGNPKHEGDISKSYPSAYKNTISVAPLSSDEIFSSPKPLMKKYSKKKPDVYAPGEKLIVNYFDDKLSTEVGASAATSATTGLTALLIEKANKEHKSYNQQSIKKEIKVYFNQPNILLSSLPILLTIVLLVVCVLIFIKKRKKKTTMLNSCSDCTLSRITISNFSLLNFFLFSVSCAIGFS